MLSSTLECGGSFDRNEPADFVPEILDIDPLWTYSSGWVVTFESDLGESRVNPDVTDFSLWRDNFSDFLAHSRLIRKDIWVRANDDSPLDSLSNLHRQRLTGSAESIGLLRNYGYRARFHIDLIVNIFWYQFRYSLFHF